MIRHSKTCQCPQKGSSGGGGGVRAHTGRPPNLTPPEEIADLKERIKTTQQTLTDLKKQLREAEEREREEGDGTVPEEWTIQDLVIYECGRLGMCFRLPDGSQIDMAAASLYVRKVALRLKMLAVFLGWMTMESLHGAASSLGLPLECIKTRCAPPFRCFAKTSVHLAAVAAHLPFKDMIFTCIAYRLYWNLPDAWTELVRRYGLKHKGFLISEFDHDEFLDTAKKMTSKRRAAYLPGASSMAKLARTFQRLIPFIHQAIDYFGCVETLCQRRCIF